MSSMSKEVITITNGSLVDFANGSLVDLTNMRIDDEEFDDEEFDDEECDDEECDDEECDDEEFDENEKQAPAPVELGFVNKKPKHEWSLPPSKAGGTPAWLNPINLPSGKSCLCDICGQPLQFLLQIYAPLSDDKSESTYHRTLFVFMCTSMSCLLQDQHEQLKHHPEKASRSIKVFRCQLPFQNQFHSSDSGKPLGTAASLCSWCGTWKGDKVCSNCKRARYCSKTHQAIHWSSTHKTRCRTIELMLQPSNSLEDIPKAASNDTWPEFEITIEVESKDASKMSNTNAYGNALCSDNQVEGDAKSWAYFTQRIARHPAQVLRYSRYSTSEPLWPMLSGRPSKANIPKCSSCGSVRTFEFQILPQLLYFFEVKNDSNSLDWATIIVYTCEASCNGRRSYEEEFSWVQLMSQSALN